MNKRFSWNNLPILLIVTIVLIALGTGLILFDRLRDYTIYMDGQRYTLRTVALTPRQVLRAAGFNPTSGDRVLPDPDHINLRFTNVAVIRQRPVTIITPTEALHLESADLLPANLLGQAGLKLFPGDVIQQNGVRIDPALTIDPGNEAILTFLPAKHIRVFLNQTEQSIYTQQPTLGLALTEANVDLSENSWLSLPLDYSLEQENEVTIHTGREIVVNSPRGSVRGFTSARSVGGALRDLGVSLQGLDQVIPAEDLPLPEDGVIHLTQIEEELAFEIEETAFSNSYAEDPTAELDTISVMVQGQPGLVVTRNRLRIENGVQMAGLSEGPWKASDPSDGVLGQGTTPVIRTEVVDGVTLEYWRKVTVYATGYTPDSQGGHTGTASGIPLTKGIIAVTLEWYRGMKYQRVYVPDYGFGTIADTGGGIPGRYWIDLGFDNDNYVPWHYWTTLYFLTPIPGYIPLVLP